ncbi:hypothetical protein N7528_010107 [Penicillium herquei]|nr:hypothetical protein N7528_010107 [Penicillium herquei]
MAHDWSPCLNTLEGHSGLVNDVTWSPDETYIASASDDMTIKIWDSSTGKCKSTLKRQDSLAEEVQRVFWSSDGLIASVSDNSVNIWDPVSQLCINSIEIYNECDHSPVWLLNGKIACFIDKTPTPIVEFWDPVNNKCTLTLDLDESYEIDKMTCSCNGHIACLSVDNTITIWDPTGQQISMLEGHIDGIYYVKWSEDGKQIATCSEDKSLRIWNPDSGACISHLVGHEDTVVNCSWSSDGKLISSSSSDGARLVWKAAGKYVGECISTSQTLGHLFRTTSYWASNGSIASNGAVGFNIWHSNTGQLQLNYDGHFDDISKLLWSPDGNRIVSASWDWTIKIWDTTVTNSSLNPETRDMKWSSDGSRVATTSKSNFESMTVWDLATGECMREIEDNDGIELLAWSPDRDRIVSTSLLGKLKMWNLATDQLECVSTFPKLSNSEVYGLACSESRDGAQTRIAWVSKDGAMRAWNYTAFWPSNDYQLRLTEIYISQKLKRLSYIGGEADFCVALSPDGNKVAFTSPIYQDVVVCDFTTQSGNILENPPNDFAVLSWSSTGYLAIASGDYGIRILDQSGQCKLVIMGHTEQIWSVAWSHDGSRIASASLDNTVIVWNAVTGSCELKLDLKYVGHFHFDPSDSNKLYTGSGTFLLGPHLQKNLTRGSLPEPGTSLKPISYGLSSDGAWVTYQGINLLRLPPEYRPGHQWHPSNGMFGTNMAINCVAVGLLMLRFSKSPFSQM